MRKAGERSGGRRFRSAIARSFPSNALLCRYRRGRSPSKTPQSGFYEVALCANRIQQS
ncbi:MAG: hypothetical protein LH660_02175 [Phormidesmis sp. CAN_BIN36]|nr:hypothetical protein [Phormidesmis sp. CAN_BIN36]